MFSDTGNESSPWSGRGAPNQNSGSTVGRTWRCCCKSRTYSIKKNTPLPAPGRNYAPLRFARHLARRWRKSNRNWWPSVACWIENSFAQFTPDVRDLHCGKCVRVCPPEVEHFTVRETLPAPRIVRSGHFVLILTAESSRKWRGLAWAQRFWPVWALPHEGADRHNSCILAGL